MSTTTPEPVTAADFDLLPMPVEPARGRHWLVALILEAPRALLFATGLGIGAALATSDTVAALLLDHVGFRLVGL